MNEKLLLAIILIHRIIILSIFPHFSLENEWERAIKHLKIKLNWIKIILII